MFFSGFKILYKGFILKSKITFNNRLIKLATIGKIFILSLFSFNVFSDVSVQTGAGGDWGGVPSSVQFPEPPKEKVVHQYTTANIGASCLSTNSRWGGNPLQSSATHLVAGIPVKNSANEKKYLVFEFHAQIVGNGAGTFEASRAGTTVTADDLDLLATKVYVSPDFSTYRTTTPVTIPNANHKMSSDGKYISITFYPGELLYNKDSSDTRVTKFGQIIGGSLRPLSLMLKGWFGDGRGIKRSDFGGSAIYTPDAQNPGIGRVEINIVTPVADSGYRGVARSFVTYDSAGTPTFVRRTVRSGCTRYTSPLMVFFDDQRPEFKGLSKFPLVEGEYIVWPEKNSPGYFVALDQNKDGKITKAYELFGNIGLETNYENGFESLKVFDTNKDKKIDKQDKVFLDLVLWKDVNGNGIGEKEEQTPLSQKIKSISLDYEESSVSLGRGAEEMEKSTFVFVNSKGKEQEGHIADVWFTPISKNRVRVVKNKNVVALNKKAIPAHFKKVAMEPPQAKRESFGSKLKRWLKISPAQ